MCKSKKAIYLTLVAFVLMLLDYGLTIYFLYNYNNLVTEGNWLLESRVTGYFVFVLNFVYLVVVFLAARVGVKYETILLDAKNTTDYIKKLYTSNHYRFILANLSFTFIVATFTSRITAIFDWIIFGIYKVNYYDTMYAVVRKTMPLGRYDMITGLMAGVIAVVFWFHLEYLKSKSKIADI